MNRIAGWSVKAALTLCLAAGLAQHAGAQTPWSYKGVTFTARAGWCTSITKQDGDDVMEGRACDKSDGSYMSISQGAAAGSNVTIDLQELVDATAEYALSADGRKMVQATIQDGGGECSNLTYGVDRNAIPAVPGLAVIASYSCSKFPGVTIPVHNFTTYAARKDGSVWIVAFDYPDEPVTDADTAMLQGAIAAIRATP